MIDDTLIEWYKEQLENGFSREQLIDELYQLGYTGSEIQEVISSVEPGAPVTPDVTPSEQKEEGVMPPITGNGPPLVVLDEKPVEKVVEKPYEKKPGEPVTEIIGKEYKVIVASVLILLLFVFFVGGIGFLIFQSQGEGETSWDPREVEEVDKMPPTVTLEQNHSGWLDVKVPELNCVDTGVDYSSGCDESTLVFFVAGTSSCPEDYSVYSKDLPVEDGFLCVAVKDREGNVGFSEPLNVSFDRVSPVSELEVLGGWFDGDFVVGVSDFDEGSGLGSCFYRVLSGGRTVISWVERECGGEVSVPAGKQGCNVEGKDKCVVEAYAVDLAGNKGETDREKFDIDLSVPEVEIDGLRPSRLEGGDVVVGRQDIDVLGSVDDVNLKAYSLKWEGDGLEGYVVDSKDTVSGGVLGSLDLSTFSEGDYLLVLSAVDLAGKQNKCSFEFRVSSSDDSCTPGETTSCFWLKGVCKDGVSECGNRGEWRDCSFEDVNEYEEDENSCDDELDNDCDGKTDDEDTDCSGGCSNECSPVGGTTCIGNSSYTCTDGDLDGCVEWTDPVDCSECNCTCGFFTTGAENSVSGGCGDGVDNDCNDEIDENDDSCQGPQPECGNEDVESGEECDDGNTVSCDGCSSECLLESCGNSRIDCGEDCESNQDCSMGEECSACQCEETVVCGDGMVTGGEECDDGNTMSCDGCSSTCVMEFCGNGIVECTEDCEDNSDCSAGEECSACQCVQTTTCGDNQAEGSEECDGTDDFACPGLCRTDCSCAVQTGTVTDACGDGSVGWSEPADQTQDCNHPTGNIVDCCGGDGSWSDGIVDHYHDLQQVFEGGKLRVTFKNECSCPCNVTISYSENADSWTQIYNEHFTTTATQTETFELTGDIRYVHLHRDYDSGFIDSSASILCFESEDCNNGRDDDCDGFADLNDPDC